MALQFEKRELYGGAITVEFPTDTIDTSDLREVPDHQEVFLRRSTLTSIIFEINEYQDTAAIQGAANTISTYSELNIDSTIPSADGAAATHHFKDVIVPTDYLTPAGIETVAVKLAQPSLANFPAYFSTGAIIEREVDRLVKSTLPVEWQASPAQKEVETKTQQLLIRMKDHGTDFCVRINIPMKEFNGAQSEAALTELAVVDQIMKKIVQTLDVKDFGLFGGGE